jgi:tRNA threonylcarbamoyladenosine biosynthesis protein TsaB
MNSLLVAEKQLDGAPRHAQDLVPGVAGLLCEAGWKPAEIDGVAVSLGPGSYTGLRVGVMAAKAFAFAAGCAVVGIPTFEVIAHQADVPLNLLEVIGDALKEKLYVQRFRRLDKNEAWQPVSDLAITTRDDWLARLTPDIGVSGPGLAIAERILPANVVCAPAEQRAPRLRSLLAKANVSHPSGDAATILALEPIYLRPSSAEEQWVDRP